MEVKAEAPPVRSVPKKPKTSNKATPKVKTPVKAAKPPAVKTKPKAKAAAVTVADVKATKLPPVTAAVKTDTVVVGQKKEKALKKG